MLDRTWQPVMGSIEPGETAPQTAARELREETGLDPFAPPALGLWSIGRVFPFYIVRKNEVFLPSTFACKVEHDWTPTLNHEHTDHRWVPFEDRERDFVWPDQHAAIECVDRTIARPSAARDLLRIEPTG